MSQSETITLKITQASLNQTALDWPRNMANIYTAVDEAVKQGSDILALEELTLTGYEVNDEFQRVDNDRIWAALEDVAVYANAFDPNLIISIGNPWRVQMRDIEVQPGVEFERIKEPLYDRLNLPFNVQSVLAGGEVHGMHSKANLYNDGRGYEKRYFSEWSIASANRVGGIYGTIQAPFGHGKTIPFGRPIIHVTDGDKRFNLAHAICEEKWVATRYDGHPYDDSRYETDNVIPSIARYVGSKDGLLLVIPNASPPAPLKQDKHIHLDNLASNYVDAVIDTDGLGSSGSTFAQFGHRLVVQNGKVIAQGARMNFARVAMTTSVIEISSAPADTQATSHAVLSHVFRKHAPGGNVIYKSDPKQAWDSPENPHRAHEEIVRNTAFWLFDYMRKTGSKGVMEALSGGADSAFNSVMVSVMVHIGMDELGVEKFCKELNLRNAHDILEAEKQGGKEAAIQVCLQEMLTGVYMGTDNSSADTRNAAEFLMKGGVDPQTGEVVQGIGGKFVYRNVQDLLDFYAVMYAVQSLSGMDAAEKQQLTTDIAQYLNASPQSTTPEERAEMATALRLKYPHIQDLVTAADGVAYENIQARGREVLIMLFANKEGKMAVANPNLDEARNAYATFGGDLHSGTINLNGHIDKYPELNVMQYLYEHGLQGVMPPIRSLGLILKNKPSAELQPKDADGNVVQHDEDALQRSFSQMKQISEYMLYERTLTSSGERRLNAGEVFEKCRQNKFFAAVDENRLYNMVRLSYQRWAMAQHKIHASPIAPTFGSNVDHQTSQRTPNISGNSKDELALLGIGLMFKWAKEEGLGWHVQDREILERRCWQDEDFIKTFDRHVWAGKSGMDYDLKGVYEIVKADGFDFVFKTLNNTHPIKVIKNSTPEASL